MLSQAIEPVVEFADLRQMVEIDAMCLEGSVVGAVRLGADQREGPARAFGVVGGVELLSIDDLVQMLPPVLGQGEPQCLRARSSRKWLSDLQSAHVQPVADSRRQSVGSCGG